MCMLAGMDILITFSKSRNVITLKPFHRVYMHSRIQTPELMPKEDMQSINRRSEYCWYIPYFGTYARIDLYT